MEITIGVFRITFLEASSRRLIGVYLRTTISIFLILYTALMATPVRAQQSHGVTVTVGKNGDFQTVQAAIDSAKTSGETILIEPGIYVEKLHIDKPSIRLIGMGASPEQTVLRFGDGAKTAGGTGKSGSVAVSADGFEAENLTIENTWDLDHPKPEDGTQAVALLMSSDKAVLDQVHLLAGQDTLYANSRTCHGSQTISPGCHSSREFFNDCLIEGHVDYIFGDGRAVFNHCELRSREHGLVTITAQSRADMNADSGYYFLHCRITGPNKDRVFLGRPWRQFATVVFFDTDFEQKIDPAGWSDWDGRLKTAHYAEYQSHGPGRKDGQRVVVSPSLTGAELAKLTPADLLAGDDQWDPLLEVARLRALAHVQ
jgi:pectinesterase